MAQPHLENLIRMFRQFMGDQIVRFGDGSPDFITDHLVQNGETWSADELKDLAVLGANHVVNTIYLGLKGRDALDNLARIIPEHVETKDVQSNGQVAGRDREWEFSLPADFGWLVSARVRAERTGYSRLWRVADLDETFRSMDKITTGENTEEKQSISVYVKGLKLYAVLGSEYSQTPSNVPDAQLTYVRVQPDVRSGSDDIILSSKFDMQLLAAMKTHAELYRSGT